MVFNMAHSPSNAIMPNNTTVTHQTVSVEPSGTLTNFLEAFTRCSEDLTEESSLNTSIADHKKGTPQKDGVALSETPLNNIGRDASSLNVPKERKEGSQPRSRFSLENNTTVDLATAASDNTAKVVQQTDRMKEAHKAGDIDDLFIASHTCMVLLTEEKDNLEQKLTAAARSSEIHLKQQQLMKEEVSYWYQLQTKLQKYHQWNLP